MYINFVDFIRVAKLVEELELKDTEAKAMMSEFTKRLEAINQELDSEKKSKYDNLDSPVTVDDN